MLDVAKIMTKILVEKDGRSSWNEEYENAFGNGGRGWSTRKIAIVNFGSMC